MSRLIITAIGPASSVQDVGRFGLQRYGLTSSGAMDRFALAQANVLVGQPQQAAGIEIGPLPALFVAEGGPVRLALAGARRDIVAGPRKVEMGESFVLMAGETLRLSAARPGVFSYLGIEGGIKGEPSFGSLSVTARAGIGSPYARPLAAGDALDAVEADLERPELRLDPPPMPTGPIRVVLGPQDDYFSADQIALFFDSEWSVSLASDRMGYRLEGPVLSHAKGFNIISDGIVNGHIQIPGNGQPLVLLADRGTTGGYPKIGAIITADLGRFAQIEVASKLRFQRIGIAQAQAEAVRFAKAIASLADGLRPLGAVLTSETLLAANLAGGAVQAFDTLSWGGFHSAETGFEA
ncbi:MAG: biotin-dependent carboxyltransferase family protein [Beijerinckiaceae bacterium]|nr:biotin-dependent carboxyltransferase family protein [Beijerinckiaceae bacterium]